MHIDLCMYFTIIAATQKFVSSKIKELKKVFIH